MSRKDAKSITVFKKRLVEAGAELLGPTNPYEILRFRAKTGVGVVYSGRRGETWNAEALAAREHLDAGKGSLAPVAVKGRRTNRATVAALLTRDGDNCFFCGNALEGDITVEHLVAVAHGGPNHVSNLFLAHAACNQAAGHQSAPEKVATAVRTRLSTAWATPSQQAVACRTPTPETTPERQAGASLPCSSNSGDVA